MTHAELKEQLLQAYRTMAGHIIFGDWSRVGDLAEAIASLADDLMEGSEPASTTDGEEEQ